jgi:hypothetical protein
MLAELVGLEPAEAVVGDALALGDAVVLGEAVVLGDAVTDVAEAGAPPADAVPAVGAAQAAVRTAVDRSAAAAMPWRKFTSEHLRNRARLAGDVGSARALLRSRGSVMLTGRRTRAARPRLRTFRYEMRRRSLCRELPGLKTIIDRRIYGSDQVGQQYFKTD